MPAVLQRKKVFSTHFNMPAESFGLVPAATALSGHFATVFA